MIDADALYSSNGLSATQKELRTFVLSNFEAFIRLVAPYQMLAHCHIDLCRWIQEHEDENRLLLWPRDHGKSRYSAFYTCWCICRDPATTLIYASATAEKAEEQLRFIKQILDSKVVHKYFPELIHPEEGKREAWNKTFIIIDHPKRAEEGVVDSTVMTAGKDKTITGKHCKHLLLDDMVVPENNTEIGRKEVNAWVAQAASIMSADSSILAVGTRYNPKDAYQIMMDMIYYESTEEGEPREEIPLFTVMMADVEKDGEYLFPRQQRKDGSWFGFNDRILARKRAVYEANNQIVQFFAQYYNDPNDRSTSPISRELFRYYDKQLLEYVAGLWTVDGMPCRLFCAVDMAATSYSTASTGSDYSVVIVGAITEDGTRYLIDVDRFQTDKISRIEQGIENMWRTYQFSALRIEAVSGFKLVATDLADRMVTKGIRVPVDVYVPPNTMSKDARVNGILEPLYQGGAVYHYRGGYAQMLEDELVSINPLHDDLKDSWAMCNDIMKTPLRRKIMTHKNVIQYHPRYGGVAV